MKIYVLVYTDGYEITSLMQSCDLETAKKRLREEYAKWIPAEWISEYQESSYCADMDAVLYNNGEDVYVWSIIEIKTSQI